MMNFIRQVIVYIGMYFVALLWLITSARKHEPIPPMGIQTEVDMNFNWAALLIDPKFWFALYALVQIALMHFVPAITPDLWKALDALVVVLIGAITGAKAAAIHELTKGGLK